MDGMPPESRFCLRSPNGRIQCEVTLDGGRLCYCVTFDGERLIGPSSLGLRLAGGREPGVGVSVVQVRRARIDERYTLVAGKTRAARDEANELTLELDGQCPLSLIVRAYDAGVAFRYRVPCDGREAIVLAEETTRFDFAHDVACWVFDVGRFDTPHEGEFLPMRVSEIGAEALVDVPLLCRTPHAVFAIAEADLHDYAGMYLVREGMGVRARLSPRLDDAASAVRLPAGQELISPWRVVMIGDDAGRLIESTLITSLNPPCAIADTSWIKPGKYAWDWWSDKAIGGVAQPMNDATMRRFIDFAAANGLEYMLIDAGWYVEGPDGVADAAADVTRTIEAIDLAGLIAYADARGVSVLVWTHWQPLAAQMDEALALYERLGLKGVKVDFMDRNDQEMVAFYHRLLAKAARHRLLIDLHGAYPPTGLSRTWPNLMTQEGVLGAEYNRWSARVTATHNVTMAYTRMLLGPMDYTPGGFRHVRPEEFEARTLLPMVMTTRGHGLAMYVVYESPLTSLADTPDAYEGAAGVEFLRIVPATWDETRVLAGEIGAFIVIARRRDDDWFVGAMTNEEARTVEVRLGFLGDGRYEATIYADGGAPDALVVATRAVERGDVVRLELGERGGAAIIARRRAVMG
jgi:alpha-glucosidase